MLQLSRLCFRINLGLILGANLITLSDRSIPNKDNNNTNTTSWADSETTQIRNLHPEADVSVSNKITNQERKSRVSSPTNEFSFHSGSRPQSSGNNTDRVGENIRKDLEIVPATEIDIESEQIEEVPETNYNDFGIDIGGFDEDDDDIDLDLLSYESSAKIAKSTPAPEVYTKSTINSPPDHPAPRAEANNQRPQSSSRTHMDSKADARRLPLNNAVANPAAAADRKRRREHEDERRVVDSDRSRPFDRDRTRERDRLAPPPDQRFAKERDQERERERVRGRREQDRDHVRDRGRGSGRPPDRAGPPPQVNSNRGPVPFGRDNRNVEREDDRRDAKFSEEKRTSIASRISMPKPDGLRDGERPSANNHQRMFFDDSSKINAQRPTKSAAEELGKRFGASQASTDTAGNRGRASTDTDSGNRAREDRNEDDSSRKKGGRRRNKRG